MSKRLVVVMYHYVRDLANTPFPNLKGMLADDFRAQIQVLKGCYEMAPLDGALAFLHGKYQPSRDLCLLTFDDGLREHRDLVTPLLAENDIQGLFFPITSCLDGRAVAPVHMSHFLTARLGARGFRERFMERLQQKDTTLPDEQSYANEGAAVYRWDDPDTARFKFVFNFVLPWTVRDAIVQELFGQVFGDQQAFAEHLYFTWDQAREMQHAGMVIGGHSHWHRPLSSLPGLELAEDLSTCRTLLSQKLDAQPCWPFSYPYGKTGSYTPESAQWLGAVGFDCAFSTIAGSNAAAIDCFAIRRVDCKDVAAQ